MKPPTLLFSESDSTLAADTWGASCGPHSIAAALSLNLEQVRDALVNYKGWMSPTMMLATLNALGTYPKSVFTRLKTMELCEGINRVQWEGKWLNPGVPARVAYFHTHWVAHYGGWVLCTACEPSRWIPVEAWRDFHLNTEPRSPFHITHHYTISQPWHPSHEELAAEEKARNDTERSALLSEQVKSTAFTLEASHQLTEYDLPHD